MCTKKKKKKGGLNIDIVICQKIIVKLSPAVGHRLELPFHLLDQNREVFTRKSSFLVIFVLAGDIL